jgi:hypothetical protein
MLRRIWDWLNWGTAIAVMAFGLTLIGASTAFTDTRIAQHFFPAHKTFPEVTSYAAFRVGAVLTVAGVAALALVVYKAMFKHLGDKRARFHHYEYAVYFASENQIPEIVSLGRSSVGPENHLKEDELSKLFLVNPKIIKRLDRVFPDGRRMLAGYYILYPLKRDIYERIITGQILNGRLIRPEDLCRRFHQASALYIGVVVASTKYDRAAILRELKLSISDLVQRNSKIEKVFARPGTKLGEVAMINNQFLPIGPATQIWVRTQNLRTDIGGAFTAH